MDLDALDRRLLALLQADGRMAYLELGEAIGLSAPGAFQRVRKLEGARVITGYHARVAPEPVGRPILAYLRVIPGVSVRVDRLVKQWAAVDEILECHRLSSDGGFLLKLRLGEIRALVAHVDAARSAGCTVTVDFALESPVDRWGLPLA